jgi:carbamoyltransferase
MFSDEHPWVLGISASHNGSACLLKGDEIVVAIQEERLCKQKRQRIYGAGPSLATSYCLSYAGIEPDQLDMVVLCVQGKSRDSRHDIRLDPFLNILTNQVPTRTIPHHFGHALSAFATSGFADAAILVVDGAGSPVEDFTAEERDVLRRSFDDGWETISLYSAAATSVTPLEKHVVDHGAWLAMRESGMPSFGSLGGMYSAVAQQIFGEPMEAGKVMGLAPYGEPLIPVQSFIDVCADRFHYKDVVPSQFRHNQRWPALTSEYECLAASVQAALEAALMHLVGRLRDQCESENLCYAGGVALNSVANERIIRESGFQNVYIMPAAEDSGTAVGAAYYGLWQLTRHNSRRLLVHDACGRKYSPSVVDSSIDHDSNIKIAHSTSVISDTVDLLLDGKIVGWFDGGSELGPRALGQRSILCDPRRSDAKEILNKRVKKREAFRPFAPVILLEEAGNWFELDNTIPDSPFMLRVCKVKADRRSEVPAIVHVDGTGRLQTVKREANGRFYELLRRFYESTGVPILLNTSFNIMGQPIIETPADAIACLLSSGLDCCVFEDKILFKE